METSKTVECPLCEGAGEVPCDCVRCVGDDEGVMGHVERTCPQCEGEGEIPEECVGCGEPVDDSALLDDGGWFCPECADVYITKNEEAA